MALPLLTRKYLLLAKIETEYGIDSVPTAASNAILVENLTLKPMFDMVGRGNVAMPDLSKIKHLVGKYWGEISFDVELRGSSVTAATPPDFGPLLRACSMSEAITTTVVYKPESSSQESITIYCWKDGIRHKFVGCVGTWKLVGQVGQPAKFSFEFKGKLAALPDDEAMATPTFQNLTPPLCLGATFSYGGWSPPLSKFEIDIANKLTERPDIEEASGIIGFFVSDREPKGSIDPEAQTIATRDVWTNLSTAEEAALSITIGTVAANRCTIAAAKCAKQTVDWGDRDGIATYDIAFGLYRGDSGDDELTLTFN